MTEFENNERNELSYVATLLDFIELWSNFLKERRSEIS